VEVTRLRGKLHEHLLTAFCAGTLEARSIGV
jgi:hypothetical protein